MGIRTIFKLEQTSKKASVINSAFHYLYTEDQVIQRDYTYKSRDCRENSKVEYQKKHIVI